MKIYRRSVYSIYVEANKSFALDVETDPSSVKKVLRKAAISAKPDYVFSEVMDLHFVRWIDEKIYLVAHIKCFFGRPPGASRNGPGLHRRSVYRRFRFRMKVLAIDPGGTTGIAYRDYSRPDYHIATAKTPEELYDLFKPALDTVVIENFRAQRISTYGLYTVRLVGGVQALCYAYNILLKVQEPPYRRAFLDKARAIIGTRQHVIHEVDALAHLLAWEYHEKPVRSVK